ncbi:MAG: hypothetical protein Q8K60_04690 [Parachlamydiaceae bacterium]|nr:hypothetical protein [Parachlamydiaceae bacterium]
MIKNFIYLNIGLFIILWVSSCNFNSMNSEMVFNKVVSETTKTLEKKYKMSAVGIGGSEVRNKIASVSISFSRYQGPITKENGRKMIIYCLEAYISAVNENEQLKPYLNNFTFTHENFDIVIINYQENGQRLKDPDIKVFANYANKIHFKTEDPLDSYNYKTNESEPYLEALTIVKKDTLLNVAN